MLTLQEFENLYRFSKHDALYIGSISTVSHLQSETHYKASK